MAANTEIFGPVDFPSTIKYGDLCNNGLIDFLSNIIKLVITAGGVVVLVMMILAGFLYITSSGDPKKVAAAGQRIYMGIVGLLVMVASFVIAAIAGQLLFGDPAAILNPQVYGPGDC